LATITQILASLRIVPHFLLAVHSDAERAPMSAERQEQAWADTSVFNQRMRERGALVYANGIASDSLVIDATGESVVESVGPFVAGPRRIAGFWILDAPDAETAREWAVEASAACNEPVELRAFH
jgi:hypothetical protein